MLQFYLLPGYRHWVDFLLSTEIFLYWAFEILGGKQKEKKKKQPVEVEEDLLKCVVHCIGMLFSISSFQFFECQNTLINRECFFMSVILFSRHDFLLIVIPWGQNICTEPCSDLPSEKKIFMYDYLLFICAFMNPFFRNSYIAANAAQIAMVFKENNAY